MEKHLARVRRMGGGPAASRGKEQESSPGAGGDGSIPSRILVTAQASAEASSALRQHLAALKRQMGLVEEQGLSPNQGSKTQMVQALWKFMDDTIPSPEA